MNVWWNNPEVVIDPKHDVESYAYDKSTFPVLMTRPHCIQADIYDMCGSELKVYCCNQCWNTAKGLSIYYNESKQCINKQPNKNNNNFILAVPGH